MQLAIDDYVNATIFLGLTMLCHITKSETSLYTHFYTFTTFRIRNFFKAVPKCKYGVHLLVPTVGRLKAACFVSLGEIGQGAIHCSNEASSNFFNYC